tara:strand:- start:2503 stop:2718 length:216 start_codon:yes stop_codon:yes gene_type:complete
MKYVYFDTVEELLLYTTNNNYELMKAWYSPSGDISAFMFTSFIPFAQIAGMVLVIATYFFIKQISKTEGVK